VTQPASVPADGNLAVLWVTTIADPDNPTQGELNAASVVDLSCYIIGDGFTPTIDEQVVTDNRLCSTQTFEQPGRFTEGLSVSYVYNIDSPGDDEARLALPRATSGFLVCRWGIPYDQAFAADDVVDVWPAKVGVPSKMPPTANGILSIMQRVFMTGAVRRDVTVAA
jgi:hypothetical protein